MLITRFTKTDGQTEDYLYNTEQEARDHLNLFLNDDSGLYKNIAVIDETMRVLCILPFRDGKPDALINEGDIVRLRKEYSHPEERRHLFLVTNINEWSERVNIMCVTSSMALKPVETVGVEMIYLYANAATT